MPFTHTLTAESTADDVRDALGAAAQYAIGLRTRPAEQRDAATYETDVRSALDFINEWDPIVVGLDRHQEAERHRSDGQRNRGRGGRSLTADLDNEHRSLGQQVVDADGYEAWATGGRNGIFATEVRNLIGGFTAGAYDSGADGILPVGSPVFAAGSMQRRRAFVRDIMSVQSTGLRIVPYVRETNQVTNETGAQMTSEGSAKAEVTMQFENYNAVIEKITAWIPVTDEILADAPTLRGYIDTRLDYMLMIREEQQIMAGTGATPQIQGLETLAGTQTQALVTASNGDYSATVGQAIGLVENVDGEPTGVVSNPLDYWVAVTKRHANQFDNGFGSGAPNTPSGNITWGLPAVRTRALTAGRTWVGDFRLGSTLFDRQQTTIKLADQHSDYFVRDLLVIRAEKRIGVAWHRPNLFVKTTVPTS